MKELFLGALLARDELNIIYKKHIVIAVPFFEAEHLVVADRVNHFVREFLRGDVG